MAMVISLTGNHLPVYLYVYKNIALHTLNKGNMFVIRTSIKLERTNVECGICLKGYHRKDWGGGFGGQRKWWLHHVSRQMSA